MADIPGEGELKKVKSRIVDMANALDRASGKAKSFGDRMAEAVKNAEDLANEIERLAEKESRTASENRRFVQLSADLEKTASGARLLNSIIKDKLLETFDRLGKKIIKTGVDLANWGIDTLVSGIKRVYEYQEKWTRAMGEFRTKLGAASATMGAAAKMARQWEGTMHGLTGQFGQGIPMVAEFAEGMKRALKDSDKDLVMFGLKVGRTFGLSSDEVAKTTRSFENMGMSLADQKKVWGTVADEADKAGLNLGQFSKELVSSQGFMLRFGKAGQQVFVKSAAYVQKLGISLKSLEGFYDMTDTFEGATNAASKLNQVFGTTINSLDLMLEQDPAKRFDKVRTAMIRQGKDVKNMMPAEIKMLSEATGLTIDETNAMLKSGETFDQYNKKKAKQIDVEKRVKDAMNKTALTMFSFSQAFDKITVAIANAIKPFLQLLGLAGPDKGQKDFKSFSQVMGALTDRVVGFFNSLAGNNEWKNFMKTAAAKTKEWALYIADFFSPKKIDSTIGKVIEYFKLAVTWSKRILAVWAGFKTIQFFGGIAKQVGNINEALAKVAAAKAQGGAAGSDAWMASAMTPGVAQPGQGGGGFFSGAKNLSKKLGGGWGGAGIGLAGGIAAAGAGVATGQMTMTEGVATVLGTTLGGFIGGPVGAAVGGWLAEKGGSYLSKLWDRWKNPEKFAADEKTEKLKREAEEIRAQTEARKKAGGDILAGAQISGQNEIKTLEQQLREKIRGYNPTTYIFTEAGRKQKKEIEELMNVLAKKKDEQKKIDAEVAKAAQMRAQADRDLAAAEDRQAAFMSLQGTAEFQAAQSALQKSGEVPSPDQILARVAAMPRSATTLAAQKQIDERRASLKNYAERPASSTGGQTKQTVHVDMNLNGRKMGAAQVDLVNDN